MAGGLIGTPLVPRTSLTGHAVIDHYLGSEISSSDNSADNMSEERQRRFFGGHLGKVRFLKSHELEIDFL